MRVSEKSSGWYSRSGKVESGSKLGTFGKKSTPLGATKPGLAGDINEY